MNNISLEELIKKVRLEAHPIGSYYISDDNTPPQDIFGGEWIRIEGRFLFGRSTNPTANQNVGDVGGEYSHTLTSEELPTHNHRGMFWNFLANGWQVDLNVGTIGYGLQWKGVGGSLTEGGGLGDKNGNLMTANTGDSQPHNNMPPYIMTNIFKRIA